MILQLIMAYVATAAFTVVFNAPKKLVPYTGLVGAVGWFFYLAVQYYIDSIVIAVFVASFVVTLISRNFAVRKKTPITVFLISGIIPLVPGTGIYNTVYAIINSSPDASAKAVETFEIAGVIAIGIIMALSLPAIFFGKANRKPKV